MGCICNIYMYGARAPGRQLASLTEPLATLLELAP
jgi:hypothetical protein